LLTVGFVACAQLGPFPNRSTKPAIPRMPLMEGLPTSRLTRFDLAIGSFLSTVCSEE
jgi:hypothetical protein